MLDASVAQFYDDLADHYAFIFPDWKQSVLHQGGALDRFLHKINDDKDMHILDCTCGIGTQAIGLAAMGHHVHGTDISPAVVEKARQYAQEFTIPSALTFSVADVRDVPVNPKQYQVVLSCDNSIAHLLSEAELLCGIQSMNAQLQSNGLLFISLRDYDGLVKHKPYYNPPSIHSGVDIQHIIFQVWDWWEDGTGYDMRMFILRGSGTNWQTSAYPTKLRAWQRTELTKVLEDVGLTDIQWHLPSESGYYQPIVTARKGGVS